MGNRPDRLMRAVVLGHLLITFAHGAAHGGASVALAPLAAVFVLIVIEIAPLAGLLWSLKHRRTGGWIVAVSMIAAFVFGLVNHFVLISPDHVSQVEPAWRPMFGTTAALLAVTEIAGAALGIRCAT